MICCFSLTHQLIKFLSYWDPLVKAISHSQTFSAPCRSVSKVISANLQSKKTWREESDHPAILFHGPFPSNSKTTPSLLSTESESSESQLIQVLRTKVMVQRQSSCCLSTMKTSSLITTMFKLMKLKNSSQRKLSLAQALRRLLYRMRSWSQRSTLSLFYRSSLREDQFQFTTLEHHLDWLKSFSTSGERTSLFLSIWDRLPTIWQESTHVSWSDQCKEQL